MNRKKVLLVGAGGVAGVAAAKMARNPETFGEVLLASRTESRCRALKADVESRPWFAEKGVTTKFSTARRSSRTTGPTSATRR